MSKSTIVTRSPEAFLRFRLSIGAGVVLGVLLALLTAFLTFHALLDEDPERGSRLILLYLLVCAPAGIAGGFYGLQMCRQDLVQVDAGGVTVDTPSEQHLYLWSDILCIRVYEDRAGNTVALRLFPRHGRRLGLYPYLPLDTVRRGLLEFCPPSVVVETVRTRVNWLDPDLHNVILAVAVAILASALYLTR